MKHSSFVVFICGVLLLYIVANMYLFMRGYRMLTDFPLLQKGYSIIFISLAATFIISRCILLFDIPYFPSLIFLWGGMWMVVTFYLLLLVGLEKITLGFDYFFHFLPEVSRFRLPIFLLICFGMTALVGFGYYRATHIVIRHLNIEIPHKKYDKNLKIAMVSDVHFGAIINASEIAGMLKEVQKEQPDVFLLVGDFADEGASPESIAPLKPIFSELKIPLGIFAVLGNHEYINRIERTRPIFQELGIHLIQDSCIQVGNMISLIGRDDYSFKSKTRKKLSELVSTADTTLPLILLDHQPYHLTETADFPIDLQLSGHTHYGQIFPFHWLTRAVFELSWGYTRIKNTNFYVSSGFGTWGPRMRIGSQPEIVFINLQVSS